MAASPDANGVDATRVLMDRQSRAQLQASARVGVPGPLDSTVHGGNILRAFLATTMGSTTLSALRCSCCASPLGPVRSGLTRCLSATPWRRSAGPRPVDHARRCGHGALKATPRRCPQRALLAPRWPHNSGVALQDTKTRDEPGFRQRPRQDSNLRPAD